MSRIGFIFIVTLLLIGCSTAPLPQPGGTYTPTIPTLMPATATATPNQQISANATIAPVTLLPPSNSNVLQPTSAPTASKPTPTQTVANVSSTLTATLVLTPTLSPSVTPIGTAVFSPTVSITATRAVSKTPTVALTATIAISTTPTVRATPRPAATEAPKGPATLTPIFLGQRVTAFFVAPDGTIYYGVAPNDESLQTPAAKVFQLWKKPNGGDAFPISPATMHLIGGILVRNGTIYFNEQGNLRRMPDNGQAQEGEVVIRYPQYLGNENLPYGHMNHTLIPYNLNGQEVMLMGMGSVLDSSFPCAGCPANIAPPYYEDFPTGRINYATFDWLDNAHNFDATHGVAGQFDEFARGLRNPWGMAIGTVNGKLHILAADNDPAFTPEKSDDNLRNSGDELNDIQLYGNYGHPYAYAGQEPAIGGIPPIVVFDDGSVPSGVAIAAGKVFVSLQNASMIVKVDIQKRTFTPVLEGIAPFNLSGVGNILYVSDFNGVYMIDASGL